MKPPRPGARVLVVESLFDVTVRSARVDHGLLHGYPCAFAGSGWHLLTPNGEGVLWARGRGDKTRAALEAAFKLSGIVHV